MRMDDPNLTEAVIGYANDASEVPVRVELVKSVVYCGFSEAMRPWLELRTLIRWAQGRDEGEIQGQALVSLNEETRQRITLQVRAFSVEQEAGTEIVPTMDRVVAKVAEFPDLAMLGRLERVRFDSHFLDPYEIPFHELNSRIKDVFLARSALATAATDVQVAVDEASDEATTNHHQIGPMAPDQLNSQLLAFRREALPDQFLFVGLGRTISDPGEFSVEQITEAGNQFSAWAEERSEHIAAELRG